MTPVDLAPMRLSGALSSKRARVIWDDGRLHVFESESKVTSVESSKPERSGRDYVAETADGTVTMVKTGCGCGWALKKAPRRRLLAAVA